MNAIYYKGASRIIAAGCYIPSEIVNTEHLLAEILPERFGIPSNHIRLSMGINEVRHENSLKPSEIATLATQSALDDCPIHPNLIDMIIFCGIEGDNQEPATAHHVQKAVGLKCPIAFDISNACMGFSVGLQIADSMIASGHIRYALICTGERPSQVTKNTIKNLKKTSDYNEFKLSIGAFSVGDAGGAMIVGPNEGNGFMTFGAYSESKYTDLCYYRWENGQVKGEMLMGKILAVTLKAHKKIFNSTIEKTGWNASDIDCLITHQVGMKFFNWISKNFGVPSEKMTKTYDNFGNVTSASLPLNWVIAKKEGRIKPNSKVWFATSGSGICVSHVGLAA